MAWIFETDVHAWESLLDPGCQNRLRIGMVLVVVTADLTQGQMGGHQDMTRRDAPPLGNDARRLPFYGSALLEDMAAVSGNGLRQTGDILGRMKLRLIVKAHRGAHFERKTGVADEPRGQPKALRGLDLLFDSLDLLVVASINKGGLRLDIARDGVLRRQAANFFDASLLRVSIDSGLLLAELLHQGLINNAVLRSHLGGRLAGYLPTDFPGFDHRYCDPQVLEHPCSRNAYDAAADDRDIHPDIAS